MFLMTVADTDLQRLLYWLWYYQPQRRPKVDNLMTYFGSIWGEFDEDQLIEYDSRKKRLRAALDLVIMKEFNYRVFQITDWKAGGAWSTPVRKLRQHLVHAFVGEEFWKRLTPLVSRINEDVHAAIGRLEDVPLPVPQCLTDVRSRLEEEAAMLKPFRADPHAHDMGDDGVSEKTESHSTGANSADFSPAKRNKELKALQQRMDKYWKHAGTRIDGRKLARKELRQYLRVFRSYEEMPIDSFGDDFGDDPGMQQFFKMIYRGAQQAATTMKDFVHELRIAMRYEDSVTGYDEEDSEEDSDADELEAFLDEVTIPEEESVGVTTVSSATPGFGLTLGTDTEGAVDDDTSVVMPLDPEVKYKVALKVPAQMLHNMADVARSRVGLIMDEMDEVLSGIDSEGSASGAGTGTRAGVGSKRRVRRGSGSQSRSQAHSAGSRRSKGSASLHSRDSQAVGSRIESIVEDPLEEEESQQLDEAPKPAGK